MSHEPIVTVPRPQTHYAKSGDVHIAYQVIGDGPNTVVFSSGIFSNIEIAWELPAWRRFYERMASFSRLVIFDLRGIGLSDRGGSLNVEMQIDDINAVLDAVGVNTATIFGVGRSASISALFAASHPERVRSLVTYGLFVKGLSSPDFPFAHPADGRKEFEERFIAEFGTGKQLALQAPSVFQVPAIIEWWGHFERLMSSPGSIEQYLYVLRDLDIRHVLPVIEVPTLVLHRKDDLVVSAAQSKYAAEMIKSSKLVELEGFDHLPIFGDSEAVLDEVEVFITGAKRSPEVHRMLTTVLFLDVVDSTRIAAEQGDTAWTTTLMSFYETVRKELRTFRGKEIKTTGDGVLACFDGPARATRCACQILKNVERLNIQVRAGLHTGECEILGDDIGGIAVHLAARVMSEARPQEVLTTATVRDLSLGSELRFEPKGDRELKGVPGKWALFAVE